MADSDLAWSISWDIHGRCSMPCPGRTPMLSPCPGRGCDDGPGGTPTRRCLTPASETAVGSVAMAGAGAFVLVEVDRVAQVVPR